jgi:hypothetical protein
MSPQPHHGRRSHAGMSRAARPAARRQQRSASWNQTRWRNPQSLGPQFMSDYVRGRHRRHRTPQFNGYVGHVDGMPLFYRKSLWNNGIVLDAPPEAVPPQDDPEPPPEPIDVGAPIAEPVDPAIDAAAPSDAAVESPAAGEQEITRSFTATLDWTPPLPLTGALQRLDGGIYVVERNAEPVYVGEASSFAPRFALRLEVLRQMGVDITPLRVRLARITTTNAPMQGIQGSRLRESIEHTVIRGLLRQGVKLTNRTSIQPFMVGTIALTHTGTQPRYIASSPAPIAGQAYEGW